MLMASPTQALDTSAGVGLQDRALFQEKVDYTLTNQSNGISTSSASAINSIS